MASVSAALESQDASVICVNPSITASHLMDASPVTVTRLALFPCSVMPLASARAEKMWKAEDVTVAERTPMINRLDVETALLATTWYWTV